MKNFSSLISIKRRSRVKALILRLHSNRLQSGVCLVFLLDERFVKRYSHILKARTFSIGSTSSIHMQIVQSPYEKQCYLINLNRCFVRINIGQHQHTPNHYYLTHTRAIKSLKARMRENNINKKISVHDRTLYGIVVTFTECGAKCKKYLIYWNREIDEWILSSEHFFPDRFLFLFNLRQSETWTVEWSSVQDNICSILHHAKSFKTLIATLTFNIYEKIHVDFMRKLKKWRKRSEKS